MSWFRASADPPAAAALRLIDPAFLARLERLHLLSLRTFGGQNRTDRRSRKIGSSLEFADYRNYSAGDDLRNVDWNIYGRLDKLFLKLFEEEGDLPVHLLIDVSASMRWVGAGLSKLDLSRQIAAALAYVGLAGLDRVNVHYFSDGLGRAAGAGRGKAHFFRVCEFLGGVPEETGETNLARSFQAFSRQVRQKGMVIVLSDLFDPRGYEEALGALVDRRLEVHVVQALDPAELSPRLWGDVRLIGSESAQACELTVNESLARAYERQIRTFLEGLQRFCAKRRIGYHRVMTDVPCHAFVLQALRAGEMPMVR